MNNQQAPTPAADVRTDDEPGSAADSTTSDEAAHDGVDAGVSEPDEEGSDSEQEQPSTQEPPDVQAASAEEDVADDVGWVRPYVWTGGKTTSSRKFALETLVSANVTATATVVRDEHRQVLELCAQPRSVSEIAALLSVPLGAAKALLGAMVEENLLIVHQEGATAEGPGLELMERVLRGLRNL